jgi:hypothetical protein
MTVARAEENEPRIRVDRLALSRMADSALMLISKTGREALDIENDMVRILSLVDWVRAIASVA